MGCSLKQHDLLAIFLDNIHIGNAIVICLDLLMVCNQERNSNIHITGKHTIKKTESFEEELPNI
jgi:hypothetical protein